MIPGCFWILDRSVSVQVVNIALSTQYHAEPKTGKYYEIYDIGQPFRSPPTAFSHHLTQVSPRVYPPSAPK
jgi:hypothetical protein